MDDAGNGRRGARASVTPDLLRLVRSRWGELADATPVRDLGGSVNLNVLAQGRDASYVIRVYRPSVSVGRLRLVQHAREQLAVRGLPVARPVPTRSGVGFEVFDDRLVEVELYVRAPHVMDDVVRLAQALPVLGRVHTALEDLPLGPEAEPAFANHVPAGDLPGRVGTGTARVQAWRPTPAEERLADRAERLADRITDGDRLGPQLPDQAVHGDFWDANVLMDGATVRLVTDFDSLGGRPRIDDLALTLFFTCQDLVDVTLDRSRLVDLVLRYGSGLAVPLSTEELHTVPWALARQALWSIAVWVAHLDTEQSARDHLAGTTAALTWAEHVVGHARSLGDALHAGCDGR